MALLDKLKDKAIATALDPEKHKEWTETGFDKAMSEARKLLPEGDDEAEVKALRETAEFALDKLEKNKASLVGLGLNGLRSTMTLVGLGQYDEAAKHAQLVALRETASWDEVTAKITATAQEGNEAKRQLDAEVEALKDMLKDIGITAAKAILPLLLAI
jgi:hypothetical protein